MSEELSRRDLLRSIALSATLGGLSLEAAQHVHNIAASEKAATGVYKPKLFNDHEYKTLQVLTEIVIPGALKGGAPEFIDLIASEVSRIAAIFTGGIVWMDQEMEKRSKASFIDVKPAEQTALLDLIAYRRNQSLTEIAPGIPFFEWVRKMAADAYYTSKAGMQDIGYMGNSSMTEYVVPKESIDYAVKRSGL